jgi:hypothetical protein
MITSARSPDVPCFPLRFDKSVRSSVERAFNANFSEVRLYCTVAPLRLGCAAFTAGENIYFAPGVYQPVTFGGRAVLAHELTHVLQQRHRRTTDSAKQGVTVLFEPELEAQAFDCGLRVARGERVNFSRPRVSAFEPAESVVAQPVIINAGEDPFYAEFRKYNGCLCAPHWGRI